MDVRVVIAVLAVAAVAFAATVGLGVVQHQGAPEGSPGNSGGPPPMRGGKVDEDRLEDWRPSGYAEAAAKAAGPFVPSLGLDQPNVTLPVSETRTRTAAPARSDLRIAQLTLIAGAGASILYDCDDADGRQCPQTACLCRPGSVLQDLDVSDCDERWVRHRRRDGAVRCLADDSTGSLIVYGEGGELVFSAIGPDRVTVRVR